MLDILNIKLSDKSYVFVRTESKFFEISGADILANGLVPTAAPTPASTVADLVAQAERERKQKTKRKASKMREFRKEAA